MGIQQLRAIYGGNSRQAMARAIRAEIADGQAILDQQSRAQMWCDHVDSYDREKAAKAQAAWCRANVRRVEAENIIRAKYGMIQDSAALPPVC